MMGYYDLVLGVIPASLVGVSWVLHAIGLALSTAVPIAAVLATCVIVHALFVRAPVPPSYRSNQPPTIPE